MLDKITRFEIEISSYCNRKCPWCSNAVYQRSMKEEMDERVFLKILSELSSEGYDKEDTYITFSKFNEPLYDMDLLIKRSSQLRDALPNAVLSINTNGDYITQRIKEVPFSRLNIMDYDCKGPEYGKDLLKSLGLDKIEAIDNIFYGTLDGQFMRVITDWPRYFKIEDRGGLISESICKFKNNKEKRTYPCLMKVRPLSIDWQGNVTPCCHIRSDAAEHKDYVMGNITKETLHQIIDSEKYKEFNQALERATTIFPPCERCHKN